MSKYDKMKHQQDALRVAEQAQYDLASRGMAELASDSEQTADIYRNASVVLTEIDERFCEATKLDKVDINFLMLATALQIGRWIIMAEISKTLDQKIRDSRVEHNDKTIVQMERDQRKAFQTDIEKRFGGERFKGTGHRDWANIVFDSVPYDISVGSPKFGVNMHGGLHRIHTLGHDPILGWLFGTLNILSDTITLDKTYLFRTFNVEMINRPKRWTSETNIVDALGKALDSVREDSKRLPAAVFAQALHLKSDEFTKLGLPVPLLEAFSPDLAGKLYLEGYDTLCMMKDVAMCGVQAVVAALINMLTTLIHGLFFDPDKYPSRELYEVKTRKILSYSNLIASSSNVITVAGMSIAALAAENPDLGKKAMSTLDTGGIIVTIHRLIADTKFIRQVKEEFLANEWHKAVVGEDYQFVAEVESMSKKDIQKGIEIQATADAAKAAKLAAGMQAHAEVLGAIRSTQEQVRGNVDIIMHDQATQEAARLYGLGETKKIIDLDHTEKRVLGAALYTLMANYQQNSDRQKKFYQCYEQYGVSERHENFNFALLNNIDSFSDRKVILKAICVFLFLKDCNTDFRHDPAFSWLTNFTSAGDVEAVCLEIEKEFSIVGDDGLLLGYVPALEQPAVSAAPAELVEADAEELSEGEYDYAPLFELVGRYTKDESAFGKQVSPAQVFLDKELGVKHAGISSNATIAATKVSNGHLIFTTYALYLRVGSMFQGEYVCLPYASIQTRRIATGDGKLKGTRKLIIPYITDSGLTSVEIDDTKVQEEKLRELLLEIQTSGCSFATTDKHIPISELPEQIQIDFFSILASVLHSEDHALTEVYLLVRDYGFTERWDEIIENMPVDRIQDKIEEFINAIPYPSEFEVTGEAMRLYLRTICRTNILEGNEATLLSQAEESYAKCFDMIGAMTDAEFSILLKKSAADIRKVSLVELREIRDNIAEGTSCFAAITTTLDALIEKMQAEETARQNTPVAKFVKAVQETATPAAKDLAKKAEEQLKRFGFPGKKAP